MNIRGRIEPIRICNEKKTIFKGKRGTLCVDIMPKKLEDILDVVEEKLSAWVLKMQEQKKKEKS